MSTRCGDIDPAVVIYLAEHCGMRAADIDKLMNKQARVGPPAVLDVASQCTILRFAPYEGCVVAIEKIVSADGFATLQSGFLGLTGDSDLRSVIAAADSGNAQAKLAIEVWRLAAHMCQPHRCVQRSSL